MIVFSAPLLVLEDEVVHRTHDDRGHKCGKVDDGAEHVAPADLRVQQQRQTEAEDLLDGGRSDAIDQCVNENEPEVRVFEHLREVCQSDERLLGAVTIPVRQGQSDAGNSG